MIKYMKDPLNKMKTAYDYFSVMPNTDLKKLKAAYKEYLKKHPENLAEAGEMLDICNTTAKRLKTDFFYYIKEWEK